jgi:hypothetical protein
MSEKTARELALEKAMTALMASSHPNKEEAMDALIGLHGMARLGSAHTALLTSSRSPAAKRWKAYQLLLVRMDLPPEVLRALRA